MMEKNDDARNKGDNAADTDDALQSELSRERAEGKDSIGDVGSNRTLSGSSSWETLPDDVAGDARSSKPAKDSGEPPAAPSQNP